jgi:hypothetical protein
MCRIHQSLKPLESMSAVNWCIAGATLTILSKASDPKTFLLSTALSAQTACCGFSCKNNSLAAKHSRNIWNGRHSACMASCTDGLKLKKTTLNKGRMNAPIKGRVMDEGLGYAGAATMQWGDTRG